MEKNQDSKSEISLNVNDLTTLGFCCFCEFCELGCCCDEKPNIFELLALLINEFEFEPINEFIGIFELLELEVDNKESNAEKPDCHNNKIRYIFFNKICND